MYEKEELRERMKKRRESLFCAAAGEAAELAVLTLLKELSAERVFVYLSFGSEMPTRGIVSSLLSEGKRVCVPRLSGGEMSSVPLTDRLVRDPLGFEAPAEGEEETCEIALVPLLAADGEGYRLGYGGGFYDGYFSRHPEVLRVGLAFEGQRVEALPREPHDLPLHLLVTERGITRYRTLDSVRGLGI